MSGFLKNNYHLCACGCGNYVTWNKNKNKFNKYAHGHNRKGMEALYLKKIEKLINNTEIKCKYCNNIAKYRLRDNIYCCENNTAKCPSIKLKISKTLLDHDVLEETRKKISENHINSKRFKGENHPFYNKKHTEEAKIKISLLSKGRKHTEEAKIKISKAGKNKIISIEQREKISIALSGSNHPNWKGGISCESYCDSWLDKDFKNDIFERDNHTCQNSDCWKTSNTICRHHIDYNKKNCCPSNIITLCNSCNARANTNRDNWQNFYINTMNERELI